MPQPIEAFFTRNTISLRNGISTLETEKQSLLERIKILENSRNSTSQRSGISEKNLEKFEINGVAFELIYVEGGTFQMGDAEINPKTSNTQVLIT